jgi:hypothetical protein
MQKHIGNKLERPEIFRTKIMEAKNLRQIQVKTVAKRKGGKVKQTIND